MTAGSTEVLGGGDGDCAVGGNVFRQRNSDRSENELQGMVRHTEQPGSSMPRLLLCLGTFPRGTHVLGPQISRS